MYTQEDLRTAKRLAARYTWILCAGLAVLTAGYIACILLDMQAMMLAVLIAGCWFAALESALWLVPALRYKSFLQDMHSGLRRECICTLDELDEKIQLQDGVRVRSMQVRLDDGDTRLFYVNISKLKYLPPVQHRVRLISFGRHVVEVCEEGRSASC